VRAVLGQRVREVIETYCEEVSFFVPEAYMLRPKNICQV